VGINQWDVQRALLLIVAIFIHECGHLIAMRACRYKNLRMLFVPFLGAMASGKPSEQNGLKIAIIAFSGPLAGLLAACVALLVWSISQSAMLLDFAQISVLLNGFNLLPILPLDGGHILNEALLARHPKAQVAFMILAAAALVALAVRLDALGLAAIAIVLLTSTKVTYLMASAINRLRMKEGMMGSDLTEEKIGQIREEIESANPLLRKLANAPKLSAQVENSWARVNKVFPGPASVGIILTAYLSTLLLVVPFGIRKTAQLKIKPLLTFNNEGIQMMTKGEFKGAVAAFDKALEMQPTNLVLLMNRGTARYRAGDYGGAFLDLSQVLEKKSDSQLALVYRALSGEETGDFESEINDCSAALRLKPDDEMMLVHRGYAESRMGRVDSGLADCDRALALDPTSPDMLRYRAYVKDIAGNYSGAGKDYAEAVSLSFAADMARIRWSIDLRRQKLSDSDVGLASRAPGFRDPWTRAIGLYLTGSLDEARLLSQAETIAPDLRSRHMGQACYYIGISHMLGGDANGARAFFEKSLQAGLRGSGETGLAQAELGRL